MKNITIEKAIVPLFLVIISVLLYIIGLNIRSSMDNTERAISKANDNITNIISIESKLTEKTSNLSETVNFNSVRSIKNAHRITVIETKSIFK